MIIQKTVLNKCFVSKFPEFDYGSSSVTRANFVALMQYKLQPLVGGCNTQNLKLFELKT